MTAPPDPRRAMTPPAVAERLGVDPDRVRGWIVRGELRAVDVSERPGQGRPRYRVLLEDLDAFLTARAVAPPAPRRASRPKKIARKYY